MTCGIYQILNKVTQKCYVGSSVTIEARWQKHSRDLNGGGHHSPKLQRAWNKYGSEVWEWNIIMTGEREQLNFLELFWMNKMNSYDKGYNSAKLVIIEGKVRKEWSEESKDKMRKPKSEEWKAKRKGHVTTEETKAKMREARGKQVITEETKAKLRGQKRSDEFCEKMKELANNRTEEHNENISKALTGRKMPPEQLAKQIGRKAKDETKQKMSKSQLGRTH